MDNDIPYFTLIDTVKELAQHNSKGCHFIFHEDDVKKTLPYFELRKTCIDSWNYKHHSAAIRMKVVGSYLTQIVLPLVKHLPTMFINIELYDIHSHPNNTSSNEIDYNNVFCFAKHKEDSINQHIPLLPDYFFMQNWGERYKYIKDTKSWDDKLKNGIIFVGSTTGNVDPYKNERIQACKWSVEHGHRDTCHFYISEFVRMDQRKVITEIPAIKQCILSRFLSPKQQMEYKYILNIDGETCRWNPDAYFMNTLNFQTHSKDMVWYTPILKDKEHYVEVSFEEHAPNHILKMWNYYENNPHEAQRIIQNANTIGKQLFVPRIGHLYTQHLFECILAHSAP